MAAEPESGKPHDLKKRTKQYALAIIRLCGNLPRTPVAQTIGRQLLRSGTGVGANFREALRSRSKSEYAAQMSVGLMEWEESAYWLELLGEGNIRNGAEVDFLNRETNELSAIFVTMIKRFRGL
jgi:four helix bundle protein